MTILSVIIPAYNIQHYLLECLDRIIFQYVDKLEVIIVNDGSSDNTGQISDKFAKKNDFIKVIHQKNQGVSAARNSGLKQAIGDYIWFVDGDDLIACDAIATIISFITAYNADMFIFQRETFFSVLNERNKCTFNLSHEMVKTYFKSSFSGLLKNQVLTYSPCDKVVKRQLLIDTHLEFDTSLTYAEDFLWSYQAFKIIKSIGYIPTTLYYYRKNREDSATTLLVENHLYSALQALELVIEDILIANKDDDINLKSYLLYSSQTFFYILPEFFRAGLLDREIEQSFLSIYETYQYHNVQLNQYNKGATALKLLYKIMGWSVAIRLYSVMIAIRRFIQLMVLKRK